MDRLPKDVEKFGDALAKAWEQYLKIIDILIALSGATALVMVNVFKELGIAVLQSWWGLATIACFGFALLFLALWRFAAQHFYEYETIGSTEAAMKYFKFYEISDPITAAFASKQNGRRVFYRRIYRWVAHGSGIMLGLTWILFLVLLANTPALAEKPGNNQSGAHVHSPPSQPKSTDWQFN